MVCLQDGIPWPWGFVALGMSLTVLALEASLSTALCLFACSMHERGITLVLVGLVGQLAHFGIRHVTAALVHHHHGAPARVGDGGESGARW